MDIDKKYLCDLGAPSSFVSTNLNLGWTWRLAVAGVATTIGSSIPVGFTIGVVNTPAVIIKQWCNESVILRYGLELNEQYLDILWATLVSIFLVGGMIGSLAGALVADKIGRKGTIVLCGVMSLTAAIMFIVSKPLNSVEILLLARLIIGLAGGLVTAVMPMYLTELAPATLRGSTGVLCPLGLCFGVVFAQVMGLPFLLGTEEHWNLLLGFYAVLIVGCSISLPWLSESPKYLYNIQGNKQGAIDVLCKLWQMPPEVVITELDDKPSHTNEEEASWSIVKLLKNREKRLDLVLVCAFQAGQQFSGINAVFYYSTTIFKNAGLSDASAQYASFGAGIINFLVAVIMIPVVNHLPRRYLSVLSCAGATGFLVLLSFSITYMNTYHWVPYLSVVSVLGYVVFYGLGLGPIPFFLGAELFEVSPRPAAMALGSVSNWTGNFIIGMTFLQLQHLIKQYSFLIFASITALLTIFLKTCLPETNPQILARREIRSPTD